VCCGVIAGGRTSGVAEGGVVVVNDASCWDGTRWRRAAVSGQRKAKYT
jgi:hypothetical protein